MRQPSRLQQILRATPLCALLMAVVISCNAQPPAPPQPPPEPPKAAACGGIRGLACPDGQTCDLPAGQCQSADMMGVCVELPQACTEIFQPVCACDGKTYPNDCERLRAGAQKDHDGECKAAGSEVCTTDEECGANRFCETPEGVCLDGEGRCEARPEICTREFNPVCGCDGKTYGNDCERKAASARLASKGECAKPVN